ncbi:MAG: hypothetical protein JW931_00275 [Methanomicrobiaceae archaeon]|nr:hypothetical protein [Methanomicrobiaceae archaeon]
MKIKGGMWRQGLLIITLLAATIFVPVASATNNSNQTPPGWVGQFDEWAGKKDMSAYNPNFTPVLIRKMDKETAEKYPGVVVIDPDMTFPMVNCYIVRNSSTESIRIDFPGPALEDDPEAQSASTTAMAPGLGFPCTMSAIASGFALARMRRGRESA